MRDRLVIMLIFGALLLAVPAQAQPSKPRPRSAAQEKAFALAQRVDALLKARWAKASVKPAPLTEDGEFIRRLYLDLAGRIPDPEEVRAFLDDPLTDRRAAWIEKLLGSREFARHYTTVWRNVMLGSTENAQVIAQQPFFERWLHNLLEKNTTYDKLVHALLTNRNDQFGQGQGLTPQAFYLASENKPELLAGSTSRIFLGVKLECAQCHPHPFASWTKEQFWEYAAFFAPRPAGTTTIEIAIPGTSRQARGRFLDGSYPAAEGGQDAAQQLANWMTARTNRLFARSATDHLWSYFFGSSLLEALEETGDARPQHAEVLDALADAYAAAGFDPKFLIRTLTYTQAYQRSSRGPDKTNAPVQHYAQMPVRGLSPEQLFDSFALATGYKLEDNLDPYRAIQPNMQQSPRREFLLKFTDQTHKSEVQTSVLQALYRMNNKFVEERLLPENNTWLSAIQKQPTSARFKIKSLFLLVLSRPPRQDEYQRLIPYVKSGGARRDANAAITDVYWALLNSAEFMLNH